MHRGQRTGTTGRGALSVHIEALSITFPQIGDDDVESALTNASLLAIGKYLPTIKVLELTGSDAMTEEGVDQLKTKCTNLTKLSVGGGYA